jgi:hypothetical protein
VRAVGAALGDETDSDCDAWLGTCVSCGDHSFDLMISCWACFVAMILKMCKVACIIVLFDDGDNSSPCHE